MKTLTLTIKKRWFDMLGEKLEEYRDVTDFWTKRLMEHEIRERNCSVATRVPVGFKPFDQVLFANGGHFGNVPKKLFECKGIEIREGNPEWGAEPGVKYFVIKLGERIDAGLAVSKTETI